VISDNKKLFSARHSQVGRTLLFWHWSLRRRTKRLSRRRSWYSCGSCFTVFVSGCSFLILWNSQVKGIKPHHWKVKRRTTEQKEEKIMGMQGTYSGGGSKEFPQSWCQWIKPGELAKKKPTQPNSCATPPPVQSAHPLGAITWKGASSLQCKSLWKYKFYTMNQQQSFTCG